MTDDNARHRTASFVIWDLSFVIPSLRRAPAQIQAWNRCTNQLFTACTTKQ
jgi:hypothetical protein